MSLHAPDSASGGASGWRAMTPADVPLVGAIADRVHVGLHEPHGVYANRLALYPAGCRVLTRGEDVVGYFIAHPWLSDSPPTLGAMLPALPDRPECYYLHDIAILPAARSGGAGRVGFEQCLARAAQKGLPAIELVAVNGADSYWSKLGFEPVANEDAEKYGDGSTLMRLPVASLR